MEIHELHAQGVSIREIARRTGHSRNTVRRALEERRLWRYKPRAKIGSKLDPYTPYLEERLGLGVTNAVRLFAEIQAQGYAGGYTLVRQFLQERRPPARPVATMRFETKPGEQAQVDFGVFLFDNGGQRGRYYAFIMVLSYSRMAYIEFAERQDLSTLLRCQIHAFEALGIAESVLYDNLKPVVLGRDDNGRPILNARFADFALAAGFRPRICQPYRAQTKGRVERMVGYLRHHFWPACTFASLEDLNQQVRTWCQQVANRRIHGTTGQRPCDLWREEPLAPLPAAALSSFLTEERKVARDGYVHFGGSRYGVPWQFAGQRVEIRESASTIGILSNGRQIALHPTALLPKSTLTLPGQWDGLHSSSQRPDADKLGHQVQAPEVQVRSLAQYAALLGGELE